MKRYRKTERRGLFSALDYEQAVASKSTDILKLRDLIPWEGFRPLLEELTGYATRDGIKVLVVQKCHGLSDDATEEQIFDRTSFKSFLGLRIGDDIQDVKTLGDFKQRIEKDEREVERKLFEAFGQILEGKGFIAREDSIVDASFGEAPRQRNSRDKIAASKRDNAPASSTPTSPSVAKKTAKPAGPRRSTKSPTAEKIM